MRLEVHAFALARTAEERSEDAWAVDVDRGRIAVADGASSAWRAGDWAAALVDAWIAGPPARARGDDAAGLVRWVERLRAGFDEPDADRAWFTEAAAARGAHAALLGLSVTGLGGRPRLRALAVGDVCLLLVRDGRLELATPLDDPDRFGTRPPLLSSLAGDGPAEGDVVVTERTLRAGDVLLAASDAMAAFLLRTGRAQPHLWDIVARLDHAGFVRLVEEGLRAGACERDDLTLVRAVLTDGSPG